MWRSDWGEHKDVISFDATFEGAQDASEVWNRGNPGSGTYYRSYVACMVSVYVDFLGRIFIIMNGFSIDSPCEP